MNFPRWTAPLTLALSLAAALVLAACGGGADVRKAQVRLVNASGYDRLDLRIDDSTIHSGITYGNTASYAEASPDKAATLNRSGSATALIAFTPDTAAKKHFTVLAYGREGSLRQVLLDDNNGSPDSGKTFLRVVNAAPDAGSLDVYLTGSDEPLSSAVSRVTAAAGDSGNVTGFVTVDSGTWRLRITAANSKTDLRLDLSGVTLGSRGVTTLVLVQGAGGVLVKALLLQQEGEVSVLDNPSARVRAVAGVAGGGSVSLRVGDTSVLPATPSPVVGAYVLVPKGTSTAMASVGGTALASQVHTLESGGDYTFLVYGPLAAPVLAKIVDDNSAPSVSTNARLRLVNGVSGAGGDLVMKANLSLVGNAVPAGSASSYAELTATSGLQLTATASGAASPLFTATDQILAAGATYTWFVLGDAAAPAGGLIKDR